MKVTSNKLGSNKWKFFLLVIFAALVTFTVPQLVFAHVLKTDGTIGAVLHIDPEDDPIVGQQAGFFFEFKDTQNKFDPANCDCNFSIVQSGKQIYNQSLYQGNDKPTLENASAFFTFTQRDIYQIVVTGAPQTAGAFSNFKLVFDVRVSRVAAVSGSSAPTHHLGLVTSNLIPIFGGVIIAVGFLGFFIFQKVKTSQTKTLVTNTTAIPEVAKSTSNPSNQKPDVK